MKLETISYFDFMILIKCSIGARYVSHSPYDLPFQQHPKTIKLVFVASPLIMQH